MTRTDSQNRGVVHRALMKGLAISLPAFITISVFAWVWGLLKNNIVAPIVSGLDSSKVYAPREISVGEKLRLAELKEESDRQFARGRAKSFPDNLLEYEFTDDKNTRHYKLLRRPLPSEEPQEYQGLSPLGKKRSPTQVVLDEWGLKREYDPTSGRVLTYNWTEYLFAAVLGAVLVGTVGVIASNLLGRNVIRMLELLGTRTPVIKWVYPHAKRVAQFFLSVEKSAPPHLETVVAFEWPRRGIWTLGLITGSGMKSVEEISGTRLVTVYVPSSPVPLAGYTQQVSAHDVHRVDIKVVDLMYWLMSGGVLSPPETTPRSEIESPKAPLVGKANADKPPTPETGGFSPDRGAPGFPVDRDARGSG